MSPTGSPSSSRVNVFVVTRFPHIRPWGTAESSMNTAAPPEIRLFSTTLPPRSNFLLSERILMFTPALSEISLFRTTFEWPRSSMLLPSNSADSVLSEQTLSSRTLSCAFSLTLKHSEPNGNHSGQQVTGGSQGLPVMASRSASRMLSPCLLMVEM